MDFTQRLRGVCEKILATRRGRLKAGWQRQAELAQLADGTDACERAIGKLALAAATQSSARKPAQTP